MTVNRHKQLKRPICANCVFYNASDKYVAGGNCTRFPPVPVVTSPPDATEIQYENLRPFVDYDDHCGELLFPEDTQRGLGIA